MYDQLQGDTATGQYRVEQDGDRCELWLLQEHGCQHAEASSGVRAELAASDGHVGSAVGGDSVSERCGQAGIQDAGLRIRIQGDAAQGRHAEPALAGIRGEVPAVRRCAVPVHAVQQVLRRILRQAQRYHASEPQARGDHAGKLGQGYVFGRSHTAENDGRVLILSQFMVELFQRYFVVVMLFRAGFQVVTLQCPGHAADVAECVDVRGCPALLIHGEGVLDMTISVSRICYPPYI